MCYRVHLRFKINYIAIMSFAGKVVVVTGASVGIGRAIAILFAKNGAEVALIGRNEERLGKVANECDAFGKKALIIKTDFTKKNEHSVVVPKVIERFGKLDVLVNNAGAYFEGKILDGTLRNVYDETIQVNLTVPILLTTDAAPYLLKTKGSIVNISSITFFDNVTYGVSKAGLDFFTKSAALELGASDVRVNSINPGAVLTETLLAMDEAMIKTFKSRSVLRKIIEVEEVAELTLYLASEKANSITGQNFTVDNGFLLKCASVS